MYLNQLYKALLTSLVLSANIFAAGDMSPDLGGFFEGNGGAGEIRKIRLANPNDPTFGACRLNIAGQLVEFGTNGGEVRLKTPIKFDDQLTTMPGTPYLGEDDTMTLDFAKTLGITHRFKGLQPDSTVTKPASTELNVAAIVVRLDEAFPRIEELKSLGIESSETKNNLPVFKFSQLQHLVKTGIAKECYARNADLKINGEKLHAAFASGCLELAFQDLRQEAIGTKLDIDDKNNSYTVVIDCAYKSPQSGAGNYPAALMCAN